MIHASGADSAGQRLAPWMGLLLVTGATMFRPSTFAGIGNARRLLRAIDPLLHGAIGWSVLIAVVGRLKFASRDPSRRGVVAGMLARPLLSGPVFAIVLAGVFFALADHRNSEPYLVYYTATSLLHFLYDGWIWKVRKPEVARPLGLRGS